MESTSRVNCRHPRQPLKLDIIFYFLKACGKTLKLSVKRPAQLIKRDSTEGPKLVDSRSLLAPNTSPILLQKLLLIGI